MFFLLGLKAKVIFYYSISKLFYHNSVFFNTVKRLAFTKFWRKVCLVRQLYVRFKCSSPVGPGRLEFLSSNEKRTGNHLKYTSYCRVQIHVAIIRYHKNNNPLQETKAALA